MLILETDKDKLMSLITNEEYELFLKKREQLVELAISNKNTALLHQILDNDRINLTSLNDKKRELNQSIANLSKVNQYQLES